MDPNPSQRSTKRSPWLLAGLMAGVAAVVAACKSSPVSTVPQGKHPGGDSPSTLGPATQISPPSEARNPRDYRKDAATHLYALNAERIYQGKLPSMLYAIGFIGLFVIGGMTGLFLACLGVDVHVHDTYFVVAHFHYIMVGGTVIAYLGGVHY